MKNLKVFTGKVIDVNYFDTSKMGNPRYTLTIQDDNKNTTTLYTQENAMLGYEATNFRNKDVKYKSCFIREKLCIESIKLDK